MKYDFIMLVVDRGVDLLTFSLSMATLGTGLQLSRGKFPSTEQQSCTLLVCLQLHLGSSRIFPFPLE
jgi:hypothetical protein